MLTYKEWLSYRPVSLFEEELLLDEGEVVNKHSVHIEDMVWTQKKTGAMRAINGLNFVRNMLGSTNQNAATAITKKIDGICVVAGWLDGRFFVASKSLFNKVPKVNYTHEDIAKNHVTGVSKVLNVALDYLKDVIPEGRIFQGDWLFDNTTLKTEEIDGVRSYSWQPNTIKYTVPVDSEIGKKISKAKLGMVFHTEYTSIDGTPEKVTLKGFGVKASDLKSSPNVWVTDAYHRDVSSIAGLNDAESKAFKALADEAKRLANSVNWSGISDAVCTSALAFTNSYIRNNMPMPTAKVAVDSFIEYIDAKKAKELAKRKTDKGKAGVEKTFAPLYDFNKEAFMKAYRLNRVLADMKAIILDRLESVKTSRTFLVKNNGDMVVTGEEGYVLAATKAKGCKLVSRYQFSLANFSNDFKHTWSDKAD